MVVRQRMVDVDHGKAAPDAQATYADLHDLILCDYELNGKSVKGSSPGCFTSIPTSAITRPRASPPPSSITTSLKRQREGAANGSINRERAYPIACSCSAPIRG